MEFAALLALAALALVPVPALRSPWSKPWMLTVAIVVSLILLALFDGLAKSVHRGL